MNKKRISKLKKLFATRLLENTLPFWISNCIDREHGGYFTSLDRQGTVFSPHKGMWMHGRFVWLLSTLYNNLEQRQEWLDLAAHGIDFIRKHGFDTDGRIFFTVTADGRPVQKRRYLFTEIFAVTAFAEYHRASKDPAALETARELMTRIEECIEQPGCLEAKFRAEGFSARSHSMAMIRINTYQTLREADPDGEYTAKIDSAIDEVFTYFVKPDLQALLETVGPGGELLDLPEGRCVNPGHALETAWFILREGRLRGDRALIDRALPIIDWSLKLGWDPKYGGLFSFVDIEGKTPIQVEWDMKYWWPHNEALYATLLAYHLTGERRYEEWFHRIFRWTEHHFPDSKHGEWFGYLHRDGSVALDLKGNGWKGPFHLPRQQLYCHLLLAEMESGDGGIAGRSR